MDRRLIIDGNAVYELDQNCMLKKHLDAEGQKMRRDGSEKESANEGGYHKIIQSDD